MITQQELVKFFDYKDGQLIWKIKKGRSTIGSATGTKGASGYLNSKINGKLYLLHRLIFLHQQGYLPEFIDHKDGNRTNNKIENLRPATKRQNCQNGKIRITNKSGYKGIIWNNFSWVAKIYVDGKQMYLGSFDSWIDAHNAYSNAAKKHFGEFARTS